MLCKLVLLTCGDVSGFFGIIAIFVSDNLLMSEPGILNPSDSLALRHRMTIDHKTLLLEIKYMML